jgi:hypothetical protein
VDEGDRTLDNGSHNPVLYQLSYAHHSALTTLPAPESKQLQPKKKPLQAAYPNLVRTERLELSHLAALEPKSSVSTNSTTSAFQTSEAKTPDF